MNLRHRASGQPSASPPLHAVKGSSTAADLAARSAAAAAHFTTGASYSIPVTNSSTLSTHSTTAARHCRSWRRHSSTPLPSIERDRYATVNSDETLNLLPQHSSASLQYGSKVTGSSLCSTKISSSSPYETQVSGSSSYGTRRSGNKQRGCQTSSSKSLSPPRLVTPSLVNRIGKKILSTASHQEVK